MLFRSLRHRELVLQRLDLLILLEELLLVLLVLRLCFFGAQDGSVGLLTELGKTLDMQ